MNDTADLQQAVGMALFPRTQSDHRNLTLAVKVLKRAMRTAPRQA